MLNSDLRRTIREKILEMDKPFCLVDLLMQLKEDNITDRRVIVSVLNEMYEDGVIYYDEVEGTVDDPKASKWVFYVA